MKKSKTLLTLLSVLSVVCILASHAFAGEIQQQLVQESTIEQVMKRGVLRVGMSTFKPWAMKDKTGKLIGFEIDVATRLAKDMGVQIEFVPTQWSGIIPALLTGKFDVIIGGMSITPERNLKVNFSIPYDYGLMSMVASKKLAFGYKGVESFNRPEVIITARLGTTAAAAANNHMPQAQKKFFDNEAQVIQEVLNEKAHAAVASAPLPEEQVLKYPDKLFLPVKGPIAKEPIGFAVRKGDFDTLNYFNNWIRVVQEEGWLAERRHYWFETRDWENLIQ
jgi:polar amino acid transport system substrate-binding protein